MQSFETIEPLRKAILEAKKLNKKIGFLPTMGFLHQGHLSLIDEVRQSADYIVVSIFVNPAQFNQQSDLEKYPRDFERDAALLRERGVDAVFYPSPDTMYAENHETWVELEKLPLNFEGAGRPGHFKGVSTVVNMLFNIVQPDFAIFGEKDFQQLRVIEKMVADLKMPLEIVRGKLVREPDGLAMSSRNVRLSEQGRQKALCISRGLFAARALALTGEQDVSKLVAAYLAEVEKFSDCEIQYASVVDETTLQELEHIDANRPARILTTVDVEGVRLLDNISLNPEGFE